MGPRIIAAALAVAAVALIAALLPAEPAPAPSTRAFTGLTVDTEPSDRQVADAIILSAELSYLRRLSRELGLPRDEAALARASGELLSSFSIQPSTAQALSCYLAELVCATISRCEAEPSVELKVALSCAASAASHLATVAVRRNVQPQPAALPQRRGCSAYRWQSRG